MSTTYQLVALREDGGEQGRYPVETIPFRPGDVLVVQLPRSVVHAEIDRLRQALGAIFPADRVLIVASDVRFLRLEAVE